MKISTTDSNCLFLTLDKKTFITFLMLPECSAGFFGTNCLQTCEKNSYGIQCRNTCNCDETEFCHRECGCLKRLEYGNLRMTSDSSLSENLTSSYIAESCPTLTSAVVTSKSFTYCLIFSRLHLLFLNFIFLKQLIKMSHEQLVTMSHNQMKVCTCHINLSY